MRANQDGLDLNDWETVKSTFLLSLRDRSHKHTRAHLLSFLQTFAHLSKDIYRNHLQIGRSQELVIEQFEKPAFVYTLYLLRTRTHTHTRTFEHTHTHSHPPKLERFWEPHGNRQALLSIANLSTQLPTTTPKKISRPFLFQMSDRKMKTKHYKRIKFIK